MNYHDYLKLDTLLSAQRPASSTSAQGLAHDEMLFITIHHSYEIWFKQILFELDSVLTTFKKPKVDEAEMGSVVQRLDRIVMIFKSLIGQVDILETMTPLDFLDFRNLLYPASGFQSIQFRLIENKLGLFSEARLPYNQQDYTTQLKSNQVAEAKDSETSPSLFALVQSWLERTPFLESKEFSFWRDYEKVVRESYAQEIREIDANQFLPPEHKDKAKDQMLQALCAFDGLFNEDIFNQQQAKGHWRLSFRAVRGALLIQLYRDQPLFQQAFKLLSLAQEVDAQITQWRYRHAIMVQRMLGRKVGTGGSSGAAYLKTTAEKHQVFLDFAQLTSFFIPKSRLPELPEKAKRAMGFNFEGL